MTDEARELLRLAEEAVHKLERKLTAELHAPVKRDGGKPRKCLALEYGSVVAAQAALSTVDEHDKHR